MMNDTVPEVTTTTDTKYEIAESRQGFAEDAFFDRRANDGGSGFSFYSYNDWLKVPAYLSSREEVIAWALQHFGNEITAVMGAYKLRETSTTVVITQSDGSYERVESFSQVEFHTVKRTTFEQNQLNIQYYADKNELRLNLVDIEVSLGLRERTEPQVTAKTEPEVILPVVELDKKNWLSRIFS